jgi:hypothetical protein
MPKESNENSKQRRNHWNIEQNACVYKYEQCYFGFEDPGWFDCNGCDMKAEEYGFERISDRVVQPYGNLLPWGNGFRTCSFVPQLVKNYTRWVK